MIDLQVPLAHPVCHSSSLWLQSGLPSQARPQTGSWLHWRYSDEVQKPLFAFLPLCSSLQCLSWDASLQWTTPSHTHSSGTHSPLLSQMKPSPSVFALPPDFRKLFRSTNLSSNVRSSYRVIPLAMDYLTGFSLQTVTAGKRISGAVFRKISVWVG